MASVVAADCSLFCYQLFHTLKWKKSTGTLKNRQPFLPFGRQSSGAFTIAALGLVTDHWLWPLSLWQIKSPLAWDTGEMWQLGGWILGWTASQLLMIWSWANYYFTKAWRLSGNAGLVLVLKGSSEWALWWRRQGVSVDVIQLCLYIMNVCA